MCVLFDESVHVEDLGRGEMLRLYTHDDQVFEFVLRPDQPVRDLSSLERFPVLQSVKTNRRFMFVGTYLTNKETDSGWIGGQIGTPRNGGICSVLLLELGSSVPLPHIYHVTRIEVVRRP